MDPNLAPNIALPLALVVIMMILRLRRRAKARRLALVVAMKRRAPRLYWVDHRSSTWYDKFVRNEHRWSDSKWEQTFRVSRGLFNELCTVIGPRIQAQDTRFRSAIPAHKLIALTLHCLAHGTKLLTLCELFAVGKSTVSVAVPRVLQAIKENYYLTTVRFPRTPFNASLKRAVVYLVL